MNRSTPSGEETIATTRPHILTILGALIGYILLFIALEVASFIVPHLFPANASKVETLLPLLRLAFLALCVAGVFSKIVVWKSNSVQLTNRRIMLSSGIASRKVMSIELDRIQNTSLNQTVLQRMVGCGDIEIESASRDGIELLHMIPNAAQFEETLVSAMQNSRYVPGQSPL